MTVLIFFGGVSLGFGVASLFSKRKVISHATTWIFVTVGALLMFIGFTQ